MDVGLPLVAHLEPTEAVEPGERVFHPHQCRQYRCWVGAKRAGNFTAPVMPWNALVSLS